ncbi:MAG: acyl carrier protein [Planctomycetia bacterium]|nr:acyl carrier protein [Planctomycetia bacterium]
MPTMDEVFEKVRAELVDVLAVDEDEVTEGATLAGDLGAESIDYLDIVFHLEKAFDIKVPRDELLPTDILTSADYVSEGRLTETGVAELRKRLPFVNLDEFARNPVVAEFANVLTVGDLCRFVAAKIGVE